MMKFLNQFKCLLAKPNVVMIPLGILFFTTIIILFNSCAILEAAFLPPKIEKAEPIKVNDKVTAFAITTYLLDQKNYDIRVLDYENGRIVAEFILRTNTSTSYGGYLDFIVTNDSVLDVHFRNLARFEVIYGWQSISIPSMEIEQLRNNIMTELNSMQSTPDALEKCKDHFLGNFQYNYVLLEPLTEIGRRIFAQNYLLNRTYKWSLPLINFEENRNRNYNKKYLARFEFKVSNRESAFSRLFTVNTISLNVYTDDEQIALIPRNRVIDFSGVLVGIDDTFGEDNYNFHFFTDNGR